MSSRAWAEEGGSTSVANPAQVETVEVVETVETVEKTETEVTVERAPRTEDPSVESSWPVAPPAVGPRPPPPPIGVRMAEPLDGGQVRIAYSFERIWYHGLDDDGRDRKQDEVVYPGSFYQQAPTDLDVMVHTFELAYAPHPRVTMVLDVPFLEKELNRFGVDGRRHDHTDGVGDIQFSLIVPFIKKGREFSLFHIGVEAPTGSIRRGGDTKRFPYDNQIGNGTWDLEWGWTYRGERDAFSWGAQIYGHHPVGTNSLHYREGSRFNASMWSALELFKGLSASLRLMVEKQNNIRGADRSLDPAVDGPSSNAKKRGGMRVDLNPGMTLEIPQLDRQRLSIEFGVPIFQNLDGPQLARQWSLKAGWQWVF